MSIVDQLSGTLPPRGNPLESSNDEPVLHGTVDVHTDPWQKQIKALARDGAITPRSSVLMARSLHHILAHATFTNRDEHEVDVESLYALADSFPGTVHDFARHATRWALANSVLVSPERADNMASRIPGMKLRATPLTEREVAVYLEGWSAR
ncbi:hypothetical protein [Hyphomicrobium sp. DY-1]|uniref:hypothetical protein n=1 Tax=Hyphomicrobium sp. DY-1 TaxID=3075650 RepID=UPI0039C25AC4